MFGNKKNRDDDDYRDDDNDRGDGKRGMLGSFARSAGRMAVFSVISSVIYSVIRRIFNRY